MKMKYIILILFFTMANKTKAQDLKNNIVFVTIGKGKINDKHTGNSFQIGLSKHIWSGIYGVVTFSKNSGLQRFADIIDGTIEVSLINEIGDHIYINSLQQGDDGEINFDSNVGNIFNSNTYSTGLTKHIRLGEKIILSGTIAASYSTINYQYLDGISFDENNVLINENLYPAYEKYSEVGAKVELAFQYFIAPHLSLGASAKYNSNPQLLMLNVGAYTWF